MQETAIAAYRSLVSLSKLLVNVFDRIEIQYPPLDAQPFDALRESVDFLLSAVTAHSEIKSEKLKSLWWQIAEIAHEADSIIDAHVVDLLHKEERYMGHSTFCEDMERVNHIIHKIKSDLLIAIEEGDETHGENIQAPKYPKVSSSAAADVSSDAFKDDNVVGLDDKVIEIMDQLTNSETHLGIITITGMGGIGKTTLAKTVHRDPLISHRFDVRLWVSVSQEYVVEDVIQRLIDSGEKKIFSGVEARDLSEKLYKGLFGRRYLVVVDDVWSTKVWDDLKRFFPRDGNGSRILMTTRDSDLAASVSPTLNIRMDFLNSDYSWKLLCEKAFPKGDGPIPELEEVGKNIARGCRGLPLSIVVIGSMLASSKVTREYWESVAKDVNSFRNLRDDGHCIKVLALSYNNLPIYLRACFLFMSLYPKGAQIYRVPLFRDWDTWGSIQPIQQRSMESVAEEYFRTLVGRNLILIHEYYADGKVRRCGLHDLLWDLCEEEYHKNQFISSPARCYIDTIGEEEEKACVLCGEACGDKEELNSSRLVVITPSSSSSSQVRPFVCEDCAIEYRHMKRLSLVKVMDIVGEHSSKELVHPTTLQYLSFQIPNDLKFVSPSFAHLLWRLQTLIIEQSDSTTSIVLPSEIWRMPQLRQILVFDRGALLTYPSDTTNMEGDYFIILKNLWRLCKIRNFRCTPEVVCRIPNLRELRISYGGDSDLLMNYSLCNLAEFPKLEVLEVVDMPIFTPENISFPNTLKTLALRNTRIPWEGIAIIGSLPTLEWLQLTNAFIGPKWTPTEGEFLRLKVLEIESSDLLYWEAEQTHFPNLEKLGLYRIHQELEIPSSIGDIETLDEIVLEDCGDYVINSAKQIWEEQREDYGNEMLRVWVVESDGREYELGEE